MPRRRERYGTRKALTAKLWAGIKRAAKLLDHEDPQVALRAVHALATLASAYRAAYADLEAEEARKGEHVGAPLQAVLWVVKQKVYGLEEPPPADPEALAYLQAKGYLPALVEGEARGED
ncbi:MAG: DNA repair protein RecN [Thermus sp.]|uniref:DNA repair protein RecN n=1 Tax=Thermus sp. TaxID=275 RepID=UPI003D0AAC80